MIRVSHPRVVIGVARITGRRRSGEAGGMAVVARDLGVRPGQVESGLRVRPSGWIPVGRVVTLRTIRGETGAGMVGIRNARVIAVVAGVALCRSAGIAAGMALCARGRLVRAG